MSPAAIIERAAEGVCCWHSRPRAAFPPKGDQSAIARWLPSIKQSKDAIIAELQLERHRAQVLAMLRENPGIRYAIKVADANTDPVIVSIGIRNAWGRRQAECQRETDDDRAMRRADTIRRRPGWVAGMRTQKATSPRGCTCAPSNG